MIEKYLKCVKITEAIDYADMKTVHKNNRAVSKMYKIIDQAVSEGKETIESFFPLLDDPNASKWLAHQLVEKSKLPKKIENKCFSIVKSLSKGDTPEAIGERYWLKEWSKKKRRK